MIVRESIDFKRGQKPADVLNLGHKRKILPGEDISGLPDGYYEIYVEPSATDSIPIKFLAKIEDDLIRVDWGIHAKNSFFWDHDGNPKSERFDKSEEYDLVYSNREDFWDKLLSKERRPIMYMQWVDPSINPNADEIGKQRKWEWKG